MKILQNDFITVRVTIRQGLWQRKFRKNQRQRAELIRHLHTHPDHAHRYNAGHDFVLVGTDRIQRDHQQQHQQQEAARS